MYKLECADCGEIFEDINFAVEHAEANLMCEESDYHIVWED